MAKSIESAKDNKDNSLRRTDIGQRIKISVVYTDDVIWPGLDERIKTAMESIGGKWYAQGRDLETGKRDIAFEFDTTDAGPLIYQRGRMVATGNIDPEPISFTNPPEDSADFTPHERNPLQILKD